eukprot:gene3145-3987_t
MRRHLLAATATSEAPIDVHVVCIPYSSLLDEDADLSAEIEEAYGPAGLGLLTVSGVPGLAEKRSALLPLAQRFAALPDETKEKCVDEASSYSFGWSHGKETLEGGVPDLFKGSYYANPKYDAPTQDPELIERYPSYCRPNIWPEDSLPELASAFKDLGCLMLETGHLLAKHCDRYVLSKNGNREMEQPIIRLQDVIADSTAAKARLLHYFPRASEELAAAARGEEMANWCGWHTDHGSLTGLTSAMYTSPENEEVPNPDPTSGLYVRTRQGDVVQAKIPPGNLAFQMGESTQIHSGGLLQ